MPTEGDSHPIQRSIFIHSTLEAPFEQGLGVGPNAARLAVEDHHDAAAAVEFATGNEAKPGGVGVAGFHPVAGRVTAHHAVGVGEGGDGAVASFEIEGFVAHHFANDGPGVGGFGDDGHVAGGGILGFVGQAVGVGKVAVVHAKFGGALVHFFTKCRDTTGVVAGEGFGDVVEAAHEQGGEELAAGELFADFETEFGGGGVGVAFFDGDNLVEIAFLDQDEGGEELLGAGHLAAQVGVFLVQDFVGGRVDDEHALGGNGGGRAPFGPQGEGLLQFFGLGDLLLKFDAEQFEFGFLGGEAGGFFGQFAFAGDEFEFAFLGGSLAGDGLILALFEGIDGEIDLAGIFATRQQGVESED